VWRNGKLNLAPDEIAKLRRLRKTLPESEQGPKSTPAKPAPTSPAAKAAAAKPATPRPTVPRQGVKLPPPPPQ
jgi:hypothetical protein